MPKPAPAPAHWRAPTKVGLFKCLDKLGARRRRGARGRRGRRAVRLRLRLRLRRRRRWEHAHGGDRAAAATAISFNLFEGNIVRGPGRTATAASKTSHRPLGRARARREPEVPHAPADARPGAPSAGRGGVCGGRPDRRGAVKRQLLQTSTVRQCLPPHRPLPLLQGGLCWQPMQAANIKSLKEGSIND